MIVLLHHHPDPSMHPKLLWRCLPKTRKIRTPSSKRQGSDYTGLVRPSENGRRYSRNHRDRQVDRRLRRVRGVCGAAVARGADSVEADQAYRSFLSSHPILSRVAHGEPVPALPLPAVFPGGPCIRDKAVQGEHPKGRIALDQLRQRPLGVQRRQPNSFVDFAALADAVEGARPKGRLSSPAVR